jgi:hypothetical protein
MTVKRCECTDGTGPDGCPARGTWRVQVGTRKTDAQRSCGRHLNRVCLAMEGAEGRQNTVLTLTYLRAES